MGRGLQPALERQSHAALDFAPLMLPLGFRRVPAVSRRAGSGGAEKQPAAIRERHVPAVAFPRSILCPKPFDDDLDARRQGIPVKATPEQRIGWAALDGPRFDGAV